MQFRIVALVRLLVLAGTAWGLAACSPITALNALTPSASRAVLDGIEYGPGARMKMDVYQPAEAAPAAGWPTVIFFYGGSWNTGERSDYAFVGETLAARGIMAVLADYRLYPQVRYPDFLRDCATALAWGLENASNFGGDPKRVFVMGHSAGAYNAAMLALDPRWLAAHAHSPAALAGFIGLAGPYDFLPIKNLDVQPVFFHPNYPSGSQPIHYVNAAAPRSFLAAASSDTLVDPTRNTVALATRLEAAKVPVTLKLYPRVNHLTLVGAISLPLRWMAPVLDDVAAFINKSE